MARASDELMHFGLIRQQSTFTELSSWMEMGEL